jgi:hypothetical protein
MSKKILPPVNREIAGDFRNYYKHCGIEWAEDWDTSDHRDRCPRCGRPVKPYRFEDRREEGP